jgi:hypothetical protein
MHGDFSRWTFRPSARYTRVVMQQGRMQLDSDWNEQGAILDARLAALAEDIIGPAGAPRGHALTLRSRHALAFDGSPGHAHASLGHHTFDERRPFTVACAVRPAGAGPLITWLDEHNRLGWRLELDSTARLSFARAERHSEEEIVLLVEDDYLGGGSVIVEEEIVEAEHTAVRTVHTHRVLAPHLYSDVAVTFDGREVRLYVDGDLAALDRRAGAAPHRHGTIRLGGGLRGELSDVRIWNAPIAPADACAIDVDPSPALIAWWPMREHGGHELHDHSGRGHEARIHTASSGAPRRQHDVWVQHGRHYVHGMVCECTEPQRLVVPQIPPGEMPDAAEEPVHALAVLEVWERYVGVIQDPSLGETALGGVDTAGRLQHAWTIRCLPFPADTPPPSHDEAARRTSTLQHAAAAHGRLQARYVPGGLVPHNALYRVEIHDGPLRTTGGHAATAAIADIDEAGHRVRVHHSIDGGNGWRAGQFIELRWRDRAGLTSRHLATVVSVGAQRDWLTLDPWPGPIGRHARVRRQPTFKWSRDNGAVAFPLLQLDASSGSAIVGMGGRSELPLRVGDWVELGDDRNVDGDEPGLLVQVTSLVPSESRLTLMPLSGTSIDVARHAYVRRWDQSPASATSGALPLTLGDWIPLERGVEVRFFGDGLYYSGDFWLIPSRTLASAVEWPVRHGEPAALRPLGPQRAFAPLGWLRIDRHGSHLIESYARTFSWAARRADDDEEEG